MNIYTTWKHLGGVGYHRLYQPLKRIQLENEDITIKVVESYTPEWIEETDVLIFNRTLGPYTAKILRAMRKLHKPVIVDVDDLWNLPDKHVSADHYKRHGIDRQIKDAIKYATAVTTTNSVLAAEISAINKNVLILPNAIDHDDEQWKAEKTPMGNRVRFGYVGGLTHLDDTSLLFESTREILQKYPDRVQFVICGYDDSPEVRGLWQGMVSNLTGGGIARGEQIAVAPSVPSLDYGEFYAHFDVALAPLQGGLFNRCKSDLKVSEAAAYRMPIIASCTHPYTAHRHNTGVRLCNSSEQWFNAIEHYIQNPHLIQHDGNANYCYCIENRNFADINRQRLRLIRQLYKESQDRRTARA